MFIVLDAIVGEIVTNEEMEVEVLIVEAGRVVMGRKRERERKNAKY